MKRVVFHVPKGGAGTTTLAALFAWHAARSGIPTIAVSVDLSGHLLRVLGQETTFCLDALAKVEPNLWVTYAPQEVPDVRAFASECSPELLVIDAKCGSEVRVEEANLLLAPISEIQALRNLLSMHRRGALGGVRTMLSLNRQSFENDLATAATFAVCENPSLELHPVALCEAASIRRVTETGRCLWDLPHRQSWSSRCVAQWADSLRAQLFLPERQRVTRVAD